MTLRAKAALLIAEGGVKMDPQLAAIMAKRKKLSEPGTGAAGEQALMPPPPAHAWKAGHKGDCVAAARADGDGAGGGMVGVGAGGPDDGGREGHGGDCDTHTAAALSVRDRGALVADTCVMARDDRAPLAARGTAAAMFLQHDFQKQHWLRCIRSPSRSLPPALRRMGNTKRDIREDGPADTDVNDVAAAPIGWELLGGRQYLRQNC